MIQFIEYEYSISGTMDNGEIESSEGSSTLNIETDEPLDPSELYRECLASTFDHFWTFDVEKKGHRDVKNVSISIEFKRIDIR